MPSRAGVVINVFGDVSDAKAKLGELAGAVDQFGKRSESSVDKLDRIGKKASTFLTLPIAAGFAAATNAASDLAEATNVTGLVFEDAREEIDKFVSSSAEGLGQSERAAREATTSFGGLLKNLGFASDQTVDWSIKLTKLASDLGSAFNKDPEEAVTALGSALRGESEPIRAFNVMLDDAAVRSKAVELGLAASTAEVDNNGKAQARLALIMEQTSDVQGDFANTSDGLANQQRILKARLEDTAAELGAKLLPIATKAAGGLIALVDAFAGLDETTQTAILALGGAVALVGPLSTASANAAKAVRTLSTAVKALALSTSAVTPATAAMTAAFIGAATVAYAWARVGQGLKDIQAGIREQTVEATNAFALYESGARMGAEATKQMAIDAFTGTAALRGWTDETKNITAASQDFQEDVGKAKEVLLALAEATDVSKERVVQLANEMGINLAGATKEQRDELAQALTQMGRAVTPTERLAEAEETLGNEFATTAEQVDAFKDALDAALGVVLDADEAAIEYRQRVLDLAQALAAGAEDAEGAQETQDRLTQSLIGVVEAAEKEVQALTEAGRISEDAATQKQELWNRLNHLKTIFPELSAKIDEYIYTIGLIPENKATTVALEMAQAEADLDRLLGKLGQLGRDVRSRIEVEGGTQGAVVVNIDARGTDADAVADAVSRSVAWGMGAKGGL